MNWNLFIPRKTTKLPLKGRYIIFSDLHRDRYKSKAGDFWCNRELYLHALKFYLDEGFTLIENGDSEELWQFNLREIIYSNQEIYRILSRFYKKKRLQLIYGNHNIDMKFRIFHRYWTDRFFPQMKYKPLVFIGDSILVTHGHQWDLIYKIGFIPVRLIVTFWKYMELLGFSSFDPSIPSANPNQGKRIDHRISRWGEERKYIMICGHTHFAKFQPEGYWYFNSGCGTGKGRVTGLELINGKIALIEWIDNGGKKYKRIVIQKKRLLNR